MEDIAIEQDIPLVFCDDDSVHENEHLNHIEIETLDADTPSIDQHLIQRIPNLPAGIDKYFFVSHSSEDSDRVFSYVEELENRFKLSCVYADRDFQPGKDISENIKDGMTRSFKVLLFLSQSFQQSGWCKFERDFAFMNSIENGTSCVIPIKLEECDIPVTFKTLTYIDATNNGVDVPAKIVSALVETYEADGFLPLDFASSLQKYENGYSFSISARREATVCPCSPAKYQFFADPELYRKLKYNKVELSEDLLERSIDMVNKDSMMWSYDYIRRRNILCWSLLTVPLYVFSAMFVQFAMELTYATRTRFKWEDLKHFDDGFFSFILAMTGSALVLIFIIFIITIPIWCHRSERDISLQLHLWERFGDEFITFCALVIFSGRKNKLPKLHLMQYNFEKCTEYLANMIKAHTESDNAEAIAISYIKGYVQGMLPKLADDFESLPEAPFNRHNVKKGKMCLCQILEPIVRQSFDVVDTVNL